ncbi:MAG: hypothetical protein KGY50_01060 [Candidatus Thermoplasmatota archaeon]|nr:hypothetical protein [Candidatus Thermoplasmatota archaeon]
MHTADLNLQFESSEIARIIHASLQPELSKKIPQTKITVTLSENILRISIKAKTTPVLRAAINSYSRWIQTALNVQEI